MTLDGLTAAIVKKMKGLIFFFFFFLKDLLTSLNQATKVRKSLQGAVPRRHDGG